MPWLIWRYVCVELIKVMLLTTAVLVVVIAFGATIKPLIQNQLDPMDVGKYALLASVPMLQFALPFSAGFAATIVMHRMVTDNEILSISVSGVPYRRILTPVFWLGILLTLFMIFLVNFAVPHFWSLLKEMVARDVTRIFTTTVEKGEALVINRTQLFADDVVIPDEQPRTGADERLILLGVAAIENDAQGVPTSEFTASYATVDIYHQRSDALLKLALVDATIYNHDDGSLIFVPKAVPEAVSLSKDHSSDPKTRDFFELLELRGELESYPTIVSRRSRVTGLLAQADVYACIERTLREGKPLRLESSLGIDRIEITNARLQGTWFRGNPKMTVVQYEDKEAIRRTKVRAANLTFVSVDVDGIPEFDLRITTDSAVDLRGRGDLSTRWPPRLPRLRVLGCQPENHDRKTNEELIEASATIPPSVADGIAGFVDAVDGRSKYLAEEVESIGNDITARFIQRSAQSCTAILLLLLGAVLAMLMRNKLPLFIYALAFLPAVADILLISGGEQMAKYGDVVQGAILAWSGNGLLVVLILISWWRLSRN